MLSMLRVMENYYCIRGLYPSVARKLAQKVVLGDATATSKISSPSRGHQIYANGSNDDDSSLEGESISSIPPIHGDDASIPGAHGDTSPKTVSTKRKIKKKKEEKHKTTVDIALEKMEGTNMTLYVCLYTCTCV